jgi:hypothetical protein
LVPKWKFTENWKSLDGFYKITLKLFVGTYFIFLKGYDANLKKNTKMYHDFKKFISAGLIYTEAVMGRLPPAIHPQILTKCLLLYSARIKPLEYISI